MIAGLSMHLLGYIFNRGFTELGRRNVSYFGVVWTQVFGTFSHPLNISWMSLTCDDSEERALAMALVIMGANIAGIYGAQIFREDDKPKYRRAFSVACAVLAFGIALAIFRFLDDFRRRRREARRASDTPTSERDESPQKWQAVQSTPTTPHNGEVVQVVVDGRNPGVSQDLKN